MKNIKKCCLTVCASLIVIGGVIFAAGSQKDLFKEQTVPKTNMTAVQERAIDDLEAGQNGGKIHRTARDNKGQQKEEGRDCLDF